MARNSSSNRAGQSKSRAKSGAMTPEEAGRLGGQAPHSCRGFECQQRSKSRSSR